MRRRDFLLSAGASLASVYALPARAERSAIVHSPPVITKGAGVLAVLPDTQHYALRWPELLSAQTRWIASNAAELGIAYAVHLGDVTHTNTRAEWQNAASAFAALDGRVPYAIATGNHDYGPEGDASTRTTPLNDYFDFDRHARLAGFGGAHRQGQLENTFHLFSIADRKVILLVLEWAPRDEVIAWAHRVMDAHPKRDGILVTHAYLDDTDRRHDRRDGSRSQPYNPHAYSTPGAINDGEQLWRKLVRHHRFIMTLHGHELGCGTGYLASRTDAGNVCHQMMSNFQMRSRGGDGYLRLLEFSPNEPIVRVHTYSPALNNQLEGDNHRFELSLAG